ncbi:DUF2520 domain-containing protein [Pelomonas sp. SE-A7]|uniref:Rossmann-like and DUF2520 domain-containing protein n=1 Tax=Pelomonas sp. SE-A7 TaxID=3054953 RepID=UPI00259CF72A|nr:DUF2520 domain-containing protein [Pelomonas sp. SE-A7]MDM4764638.1 DUF2520 domain-containing protein [Pelomonas sp. SE-A7]
MDGGIAIIGCGRLGQTLARAFDAAGQSVSALGSRRPEQAEALASRLTACRALPAQDAAARASLVFLCVPDDAIRSQCEALAWRADQAVVHCSGATDLSALEAARAAGAAVGGFHPLQIFSDPELALQRLPGCSVGIEASSAELRQRLKDLALRLSLQPLDLKPGQRAAYHGAASYAASFLLSMLDESRQIWGETLGLTPEQTLKALLPLARSTLEAAERRGLAGAQAGPISRGDAGVVAEHLRALDALGGEHGRLYREFSRRQLELAAQSGRLSPTQLERLRLLLAS